MGPDDCQFFPIDIQFKGRSLGLTYWVVHVLNWLDCIDTARSSSTLESHGNPYYSSFVIDPSKVPPAVSTFQVLYTGRCAIIRDALRRKLLRAKVTGCFFYNP